MPTAGGDTDYLRRAYGERAGFAFAWFFFFVSKTGGQAIIATIFGRYFQAVLAGDADKVITDDLNDDDDTGGGETYETKALAVGLIVIVTLINCCGIKESATLSLVLTCTKVFLVLCVFFIAMMFVLLPDGNSSVIEDNLAAKNSFNGSNGILGFGSSLV